ncbi:peptidase domain-containing ABC transporter [Agrobacterium burrii]|uniref:Peptidase domain-containing ABC transporter n=1 Tax=Agrobacterium burrii TaxID=2815339 RepID=A0ABS3EJ12_9HYPH|nr:peptidase domain-containing ABC transporter [Agrobacterium burrii]MBO0131947.1 peptidase domain-containing ABC transporter [Agrobacterium burrii]
MLLDVMNNRSRIVPVLQSEAAECGLACLAMVASHHGHLVTMSELRRRHAVSAKGTTLKSLISIADDLAFTGRALKVEMDGLGQLKTPCILHWDMSHYVVLSRANRKWIKIHDPASGYRHLTLTEASAHFTGVALELTPAASFQKRQKVERVHLTDLWSRSAGFIPSLVQILLLTASLQFFALVSPLINQLIVDEAIAKGDFSLLNIIVIGAGLLLLIQGATTLLRGYVQMHFSTLLTFQMRGNLLRHALRLPVPWFEKRRLGDILSRFNSLQPVEDLLTGGLVSGILDGLMAILTLAVMLVYAPYLALVVLASLAVVICTRLITFPWLRNLTNEGIQYQARVDSVFLETIRGARAFKLFGRELERHGAWQNAYVASLNNNVRLQKIGLKGTAGLSIVTGGELLLVFYLGASAIIRGEMTLGMLLAFLSYRGQFSSAALSFVEQCFQFRMTGLHLERLSDAVHQDAEPGIEAGSHALRPVVGGLSIRNLSFRYAEREAWVLKNVSLDITAGQSVVFVGPSGGGKSTLLKVLMGLYPPCEGEILVDSLTFNAVGMRTYRAQIGVVMQDDQLFAGTIADNIAFFDPEMDMAQVEYVARKVDLHQEIERMPMGYMTLVGDLGTTLSGGQQQRALLARALYKRPKILFLDEGTANLDLLSERRVMQSLKGLGITQIMVAHRPGAIEGASRIFAIEAGEVRELHREIPAQPLQVVP